MSILDFDEILINVKNLEIRKYLEEAIKSYQVGNYRSAILAIWVATMFDLVKKFEVLVEQRESTAIQKWNSLKPKIENHQNWEKELIHAAKAAAMISRYEADTLEVLSKTRNRYAHPSFDDAGSLFDPTPEEVRYFIRTLYDIVLSQPAQLGTFYINQLIESIKEPSYFSFALSCDELHQQKSRILKILNKINQRQIPRFIKELFKALNSPVNEYHELNIVCFLVNIWGAKSELDCSLDITNDWDFYVVNQELSIQAIEGILNYPECINDLSEVSQEKLKKIIENKFIKRRIPSESVVRFLSFADIVPIARSVLDSAPEAIPLSKVIEQSSHYQYLFGDNFSNLFGKSILDETRQALRTCNGYVVNPLLSIFRKCNMWDVADSLPLEEQMDFAGELIASLNSNNWETMDLLHFENRDKITIKWSKLLLEKWLCELRENGWVQKKLHNYLAQFLGLLERYTSEIGDYGKIKEAIQNIESYAPDADLELKSDELLWSCWQNLLAINNNASVSKS